MAQAQRQALRIARGLLVELVEEQELLGAERRLGACRQRRLQARADAHQRAVPIAQRQRHDLIVEQNARLALSIADRGYVLSAGRVTHHGAAATLAESDEVKKAYLGIV